MNQSHNAGTKARMRIKYNVGYQLRDENGNVKSLFSLNKIGQAILRWARSGYTPYNADGSIKDGLRARLALGGLRINGITGSWADKMIVSNVVTNAGKADVAGLINGATSPSPFDYVGIGTGTTAVDVTDTTLETEITTNGGERSQGTATRETTDVSNDTAQVVETLAFTGSFAVTESGLLNAGSGGTLLCHQTFSAVNVTSGDSLQVTWQIDVD